MSQNPKILLPSSSLIVFLFHKRSLETFLKEQNWFREGFHTDSMSTRIQKLSCFLLQEETFLVYSKQGPLEMSSEIT